MANHRILKPDTSEGEASRKRPRRRKGRNSFEKKKISDGREGVPILFERQMPEAEM